MVVLMLMLGCPSEFGKDGRVNKAVHKDAVELLREECDPAIFRVWCENGRENTPECIEKCSE
jgi:hypothetical protein